MDKPSGGFIRGSLNRKIQLFVALVFIVALAGLQAGMWRIVSVGVEAQYLRELEQTTDQVSTIVHTFVDSSVRNYLIGRAESARDLFQYYYDQSQAGVMSESRARQIAANMLLDPKFGKIGKTGYLAGVTSKGILAIHPKTPGADASSLDFMKRAMSMRNGYLEYSWKNPGEDVAREKAGALSYFEPWDIIIWASSYKSEFFDLVDLRQLQEPLGKLKLGKSGYVFVMDGTGTLVFHPTRSGQYILGEQDLTGRYYAREMLERKSGTISYGLAGDKTAGTGLTRFTYFPELDLTIAAKVYRADIFDLVRRVVVFGAIAAVIALAAASILVGLLVTRLTRPITAMRAAAAAVSGGNLRVRVQTTSSDEIGMMSTHFNDLVKSMESIVKGLKSSSARLFEAVQDLSVSAQETTTTSNQQAAAVKEIVSTMEDSHQLFRGIAARIKEVSSIANNTRRVVDEGETKVHNISGKMGEIRGSNDGTIKGIRTLGERIDSIWEIVNIINGIADQTKVIAFNAELEAATAGSAGKNFQIVAAEIRRLADSTVASTTEIRTKITEIQHSSDHLIIASEEGTNRIKEGDAISGELRAMFEDIRDSSDISAKAAEKIALSISQQVTAYDQILQTLRQISEGIDGFVTTTRFTVKSSGALKEMAEAKQSTVDSYVVSSDA